MIKVAAVLLLIVGLLWQSAVSQTPTDDAKLADLLRDTVDDSAPGSVIKTNFGTRISNTVDTLKVGPRGPSLMEDFHFREKLTHFDHERIPERVVHARGAGAHGYFELYDSLSQYTKAAFLQSNGTRTPVFVRFSTVLGFRGAADTVRDVRGFATKFYTTEGNFDLVGNNIPIFFIQDAIKFPDLIHAGKPEPHNEIPQGATAHDNFWDFISLTPESAHMIMWALSDRAIPRSYRMMQGFGVHSFVFVNDEDERFFVKFHWFPLLGTHSLVWDESLKLMGVDSDFHRRDLWEAIEAGAFPEWELGVQIVPAADENMFDFDLLDPTKIIPEELVPLRIVGKMVLNRNPDNFFAEVEQSAFHTGHLVPGIEASHDPLLQGRMFSYTDTQLIRLGGPNFEEIPINRPITPVTNNQRDGYHRMKINKGRVNYFPNRLGSPDVDEENGYTHVPILLEGPKVRARGPKFSDFFSQARMFFNSLSWWERDHLIDAGKFELGHVEDYNVRQKVVDMFSNIDSDLATEVAIAVGVSPPPPREENATLISPSLSQNNTIKNTIKTRKVAFLITAGHDASQVSELSASLKTGGAIPIVIGPNKGNVSGDSLSEESSSMAQFSFLTTKSVMFDAVVLVGGQQSLSSIGSAINFIYEAFKHYKPIAALDEGVDLLESLNLPGISLATNNATSTVVSDKGVVTAWNVPDTELKLDSEGFGQELFAAIAAHRHFNRDVSTVPA